MEKVEKGLSYQENPLFYSYTTLFCSLSSFFMSSALILSCYRWKGNRLARDKMQNQSTVAKERTKISKTMGATSILHPYKAKVRIDISFMTRILCVMFLTANEPSESFFEFSIELAISMLHSFCPKGETVDFRLHHTYWFHLTPNDLNWIQLTPPDFRQLMSDEVY